MKNKRAAATILLWAITLLVLVQCITGTIGIVLPDALKIILGILDLVALPVMIFCFVQRFRRE